MTRYRKKPVVVEAMRYTGGNHAQMEAFCPRYEHTITEDGIQTLEGFMRCTAGDMIIKGVQGEFYPCKPDIFEATYELAD